jgi:hypothetical protein
MPLSFPLISPATTRTTSRVKWAMVNMVSMSRSNFNGIRQVQEWPGEWWEADVTLAAMKRSDAAQWIALLSALRGQSGTMYFGDPNGKTAQGAGGSPLMKGATQGPKWVLMKGFANSTLVLKAGDYFQVGAGVAATRITTSGGSTTVKYYYSFGTSVNGQNYVISIRVKNLSATKTVRIISTTGGSVDVSPGAEAAVSYTTTGNGVNPSELSINSLAAGDALDFIAWAPRIQKQGIDENLIPSANQNFVGWSLGPGPPTVTLVQNYNQRLYQAQSDVTSDSAGNAGIEIFPRWRTGDAVADGDPVTLSSPKGVFFLADNRREYDIDNAMNYGISFKLVESF